MFIFVRCVCSILRSDLSEWCEKNVLLQTTPTQVKLKVCAGGKKPRNDVGGKIEVFAEESDLRNLLYATLQLTMQGFLYSKLHQLLYHILKLVSTPPARSHHRPTYRLRLNLCVFRTRSNMRRNDLSPSHFFPPPGLFRGRVRCKGKARG